MTVIVEKGRFLSVACDPEERIVYDRKAGKYHLLRESAASLWAQIEAGGTFDVEASGPDGEEDPVSLLTEAGLVELVESAERGDFKRVSRRMWIGQTGKLAAAAIALPLVATLSTPRIVLGGGVGSGVSGPSADFEVDSTPAVQTDEGSTHSDCSTHDYVGFEGFGSGERLRRWKNWLERFWR